MHSCTDGLAPVDASVAKLNTENAAWPHASRRLTQHRHKPCTSDFGVYLERVCMQPKYKSAPFLRRHRNSGSPLLTPPHTSFRWIAALHCNEMSAIMWRHSDDTFDEHCDKSPSGHVSFTSRMHFQMEAKDCMCFCGASVAGFGSVFVCTTRSGITLDGCAPLPWIWLTPCI